MRAALFDIVKEQQPATIRQVFYQAVSRGLVQKTEAEYHNVVVRLLGQLRLEHALPWGWITDSTRSRRKPLTYSSVQQALRATAEYYRRSVWSEQQDYVEVWCEKDALAGVLWEVTAQWDVPLMVTRGYSSLTFLYDAAQAIEAQGRDAYIYYFGDHDPSGKDIARVTETRLREFAPEADIEFQVVAVTPWQIAAWNLPTRPTKSTDTRRANFQGESVELDAIPANELRRLVERVILSHIDQAALDVLLIAEKSEREILRIFAQEVRW